jgi:hypothetical protein
MTTYERGKVDGERQLALSVLEARFGPLSPEVKRRVEALSPEELRRILLESYKVQSPKQLGLEE